MKKKFRYKDEEWSFLNENFTLSTIIILLVCVIGYLISGENSIKEFFVILFLIYLYFGIKTIMIISKYHIYKKNGKRCNGKIIDVDIVEGADNDFGEYSLYKYKMIYLIVEYICCETGKKESFKTSAVNISPYSNLSSLEVNVYIQPDGTAWATDFKTPIKCKS